MRILRQNPYIMFWWRYCLAWGPWGQCDQSWAGQNCGGFRERRRQCKCTCAMEACLKKCANGDLDCKGKCAEKEFPDPSKCRPFNSTIHNKTFTDTDRTECSPCFLGRKFNYTSIFVLICDLILKTPLNGHSGILGPIITAPSSCVMNKANNQVSHTVTPNLSKA